MVTELEIEGLLDLSAGKEFSAGLAVAQELLNRVEDTIQRITILFEVITCSTWLGLLEQAAAAVEALDPLVGPEVARVFAAMSQAAVDVEAGRANEALGLINRNLESSFMHTENYRDWLYHQLVLKANALTRLARHAEALGVLDEAIALIPGGKYEADLLVNRANCLMAMDDYENAFITAKAASTKADAELAALGMLQMAESRLWQRRVPEAMALYLQLEKQLPRKYVDANRVQEGIARATALLEKSSPQMKPF
jgi:tetratricopeptide (TPR) repeat protein